MPSDALCRRHSIGITSRTLRRQRSAAIFDPRRLYRYALWRTWDATRPAANFVLLNPSTADERADDPTIRRCAGFARDWGFGGIVVTNLFALRATDPRALRLAPDPVGPQNDVHLRRAAAACPCVVVAWGVHGTLRGRDGHVLSLLADRLHTARGASAPSAHAPLLCLGLTADGQPRHPLYLPLGLKPVVFDRPP